MYLSSKPNIRHFGKKSNSLAVFSFSIIFRKMADLLQDVFETFKTTKNPEMKAQLLELMHGRRFEIKRKGSKA
jgi:hypothetical protein